MTSPYYIDEDKSRAGMTSPYYIDEDKSDMRGIKHGWYAVEDDGNLSSGPFASREECIKRITQPKNGTNDAV
jgi:hypothetical protein